MVGCDLRQMLTVYVMPMLLGGGLMRTTTVSGELGSAAARVGAPACGVVMTTVLRLGASSPLRAMPTARIVSAVECEAS